MKLAQFTPGRFKTLMQFASGRARTVKEIAPEVGSRREIVVHWLLWLRAREYVMRTKYAHYQITEKGRDFLLSELLDRLYDKDIMGGALHVVVDDINTDKSIMFYARQSALRQEDEEALAILDILESMRVRGREKALRDYRAGRRAGVHLSVK